MSNGKMLGRIAWSLRNHPGVPCGECESGWPLGRHVQKRRERRSVRKDIEAQLAERAAEAPRAEPA